jgi:hypothetical protein
MALDQTRTLRGALAGAVAAGVWAAQQPLDKRLLESRYDDVELLGKAVTRRRTWYPVGLALHLGNGAVFGGIYANLAPLLPAPAWARGPLVALTEHVGLWPLARFTDRLHPARDDLPRLTGNARAFAQAAWRHLVFGLVMGEIERRLNAQPEPELPYYDGVVSSNGHGDLDRAVTAEPTT